jgi:hypothetical protein
MPAEIVKPLVLNLNIPSNLKRNAVFDFICSNHFKINKIINNFSFRNGTNVLNTEANTYTRVIMHVLTRCYRISVAFLVVLIVHYSSSHTR